MSLFWKIGIVVAFTGLLIFITNYEYEPLPKTRDIKQFIKLTGLSIEFDGEIATARGRVTNNSSKSFRMVAIEVEFIDEDGGLVDVIKTPVEDLRVSQTRPFETSVKKRNIHSFKARITRTYQTP